MPAADTRVVKGLDKVLDLELLVPSYAGATCIPKWVIRTVLQEAADGLLACWIQRTSSYRRR